MKRAPALIPLSHDHHTVLEIALRLRRATGAEAAGAMSAFQEFWEPRGRRHFEIEEDVLLPALTGADWDLAATRVREEHAAIRDLAAHAPDGAQGANELGELLHAHVRFEERELFGMLEDGLSPAALEELGHRLSSIA